MFVKIAREKITPLEKMRGVNFPMVFWLELESL
ncbi:MAG: hypothetical protein FD147_359 [Chloroflexi bacterium]|nr:MAG: hypothetical protein FD147_359 [Chloroflexota bacterium]